MLRWVLLGEAGGEWLSTDVEWLALEYGVFVGKMGEDRTMKKVLRMKRLKVINYDGLGM